MSIWLMLLIIFAVLTFMAHPSLRYRKCERWRGEQFAHRGLHDIKSGVVENTLPAFIAARDQGFGMELDIRFTKDMQVVVFHDDDLLRLAGDARKVCQLTLDELKAIPLGGIDDARAPTLREVLDAVDGKTPLLIELKSGRNNSGLCRALMDSMEAYKGEFLVESFNPLIVAWFRFTHPRWCGDSWWGQCPAIAPPGMASPPSAWRDCWPTSSHDPTLLPMTPMPSASSAPTSSASCFAHRWRPGPCATRRRRR